jgi:hypothetical protein
MKKYLIILSFIFPLVAAAQVPGYMGKKLTVIYSNSFAPVLNTAMVNGKGNRGLFAFNDKSLLGVEYVRAKRRVIGLAAEYMRTGLSGSDYLRYSYPESSYYQITGSDTILSGQNTGTYFFGNEAFLPIRNTGLSLYWKFFSKHYIAPWGKYQRIDIGIMQYWTKKTDMGEFTYVTQQQYYNNNNGTSNTVTRTVTTTATIGDEIRYKAYKVGYGFGNQRIFNDKIIVDYGIKLSTVFRFDPTYYLPDRVRARINAASSVMFNIGIGFLAK